MNGLCTMCEENRRKLGLPTPAEPPSRVDVGGVMLCPTHDLAGPMHAYPDAVAEAVNLS